MLQTCREVVYITGVCCYEKSF